VAVVAGHHADLQRVLSAHLQESGVSPADYQVLLALSEAGRVAGRTVLAAVDLAAGSVDQSRSCSRRSS
jgi:hypothetical protein